MSSRKLSYLIQTGSVECQVKTKVFYFLLNMRRSEIYYKIMYARCIQFEQHALRFAAPLTNFDFSKLH
jgi:hypothetical protein